jgi:hypothetical protein
VTSRIFLTIGATCLAVLGARADSVSGFGPRSRAFAVSTNQYLAQPFVLKVSRFTFGSTRPGSHRLSSNLGSVPLELLAANSGQVNTRLAPGSTWTSNAGIDPAFDVHETAGVPEPATGLMLLTGLIGATRIRRSRRRIQVSITP